MSYIKKKLVNKETDIVKTARITKWVLFNESVLLGIALAIFIAGFFRPLNWPQWSMGPITFGLMNVVGLVLVVIMLIALCVELIKRASIEIVVTTTRLIGKKGILKIDILDKQLEHVDFIKVQVPLLGRIFGFGDVTVGSNNKEYVYKKVAKPFELRKVATEQQDHVKSNSGAVINKDTGVEK
ncbi:MAG: PH domain-containing protein [Firmicutes bacterium]|nr:PH domain-containing protein [Bacillota bacterium]